MGEHRNATSKIGVLEVKSFKVVQSEKISRDNTEVSPQGDGAEVYRINLGLLAGNPSERTRVTVWKPVMEYGLVWERSLEGDQLLSGISES